MIAGIEMACDVKLKSIFGAARSNVNDVTLERAEFTLIGVADDVFVVARGGPAQAPLQPGSKPCTAVPAQPGFGDRADRLLGVLARQVLSNAL